MEIFDVFADLFACVTTTMESVEDFASVAKKSWKSSKISHVISFFNFLFRFFMFLNFFLSLSEAQNGRQLSKILIGK